MREILFRAKRKDNGEWVEGLLWKKKYNTTILFISCFPDKDDNEEVFVIDPETVGQYTGLKDENGTKIFEGDILRHNFDDGFYDLLEVVYDEEFAKFQYRDVKMKGFKFDMVVDIETVVGNIFDNEELLQ